MFKDKRTTAAEETTPGICYFIVANCTQSVQMESYSMVVDTQDRDPIKAFAYCKDVLQIALARLGYTGAFHISTFNRV